MNCLRNFKPTESALLIQKKTLKTIVWILWRKENFITIRMMAMKWIRKIGRCNERPLGIKSFLEVISGFLTIEIKNLFPSSNNCPKIPKTTKIHHLYSKKPTPSLP
jgi:hypothetical protein